MTPREEAIEVCAINASNAASPGGYPPRFAWDPEVAALAWGAFGHALDQPEDEFRSFVESWAEAECLLREGWSP